MIARVNIIYIAGYPIRSLEKLSFWDLRKFELPGILKNLLLWGTITRSYECPKACPHEDMSNLLLWESKEFFLQEYQQLARTEAQRFVPLKISNNKLSGRFSSNCPYRVFICSYIVQKQEELFLHLHFIQILFKLNIITVHEI